MRRFLYRHRLFLKPAGLCAVIVCSMCVLFAVYRHYHPPQRQQQETVGTEAAVSNTERRSEAKIRGSEVKEKLSALKKDDSYAVIVATKELLLDRTTTESAYLVYLLDDKKQPRYVTAEGATAYLLFGVNYGRVLKDTVLMNTGLGLDSYYTIAGFMEDAEYAKRNNYEAGTTRTVIVKDVFHPYVPEESLFIPDDEYFYQGFFYDRDEKEIGCIYYSSLN